MFHQPPRNFLYSAHKIAVSFSDGFGTTKTGLGTGFFIELETNVVAFITNRHVLEPDYKSAKYRDFGVTNIEVSGYQPNDSHFSLSLKLNQVYYTHDDDKNDIACIIQPRSDPLKDTGEQQSLFRFTMSHLAHEDVFMNGLQPFDELAFSGYPGQHDKSSSRPILRGGRVASDPRYNYSHSGKYDGECVAYEGFSSEGASGSPVFAPSRGSSNIANSRNGFLVGINAGHLTENYGHSGISYFYKSTAILKLLDEAWFKQKG